MMCFSPFRNGSCQIELEMRMPASRAQPLRRRCRRIDRCPSTTATTIRWWSSPFPDRGSTGDAKCGRESEANRSKSKVGSPPNKFKRVRKPQSRKVLAARRTSSRTPDGHPSGIASGAGGKHAVGALKAAAPDQEERESDFSILSIRESVPPFFELFGLAHSFRVSPAFALPLGRQFNAQTRSSSVTGFPLWIASSLTSLTSWRMSRPDKRCCRANSR